MTQSTSTIATLAAALIGRTVTSTDKTGATASYTISKLSDKLGTMKNGEKAEYVVLQSTADSAVVVSLHPEAAKRLMTKGADGTMVLEATASDATTTPAADPAPATKVKKAKAPKAAKPAKVKKAKAPKAEPAAKEPSKKDQFMAVFTANAGKTRQEIKAAAESLGLSLAGFNTYYQNAKSGKWA